MPYSQVSSVKVLSFISRRGKGHTEVLNHLKALSFNNIEPIQFLKYFIDVGKKTFTKETLQSIADDMVKDLKLTNLVLTSSFNLLMDKLSPTFEVTTHVSIPCEYTCYYDRGESSVSMKVSCPVRIDYVSTLNGTAVLELHNPVANTYFEDLLDVIHKYGDVVIYPLCFPGDERALEKEIGRGKSMNEYLQKIKDGCVHKGVSENGRVFVYFTDLYKVYNLEKGLEW